MFWYHRDEENDLEETEDNKQRKETSKRVTFALPDDEESGGDEETEETRVFNAQKDPAEVKSSFEKRQEKVIDRNLRDLSDAFLTGTCTLLTDLLCFSVECRITL